MVPTKLASQHGVQNNNGFTKIVDKRFSPLFVKWAKMNIPNIFRERPKLREKIDCIRETLVAS
jgi:hypothetical protein